MRHRTNRHVFAILTSFQCWSQHDNRYHWWTTIPFRFVIKMSCKCHDWLPRRGASLWQRAIIQTPVDTLSHVAGHVDSIMWFPRRHNNQIDVIASGETGGGHSLSNSTICYVLSPSIIDSRFRSIHFECYKSHSKSNRTSPRSKCRRHRRHRHPPSAIMAYTALRINSVKRELML